MSRAAAFGLSVYRGLAPAAGSRSFRVPAEHQVELWKVRDTGVGSTLFGHTYPAKG
jgi:hypothetical protein